LEEALKVELKKFSKIPHFDSLKMTITQKIHGSNAQVCIYADDNGELQLKTASRTRWITPHDDNYGFANFVYSHKQEFIEKLGLGIHFGEWAGKGINSGEGLKEKTFILFNFRRFINLELPPNTRTVPVLYSGDLSEKAIETTFFYLKENGSALVAGYMKPEGIVVEVGGQLYKKVFDNETVPWKICEKSNKRLNQRVQQDVSHLLQPIRLEKLLSRDESYLRDYPRSLSSIAADYVKDLMEENQITGDEDEVKAIKKAIGGQVFYFIKTQVSERTCST
jgi:hypothetical protein